MVPAAQAPPQTFTSAYEFFSFVKSETSDSDILTVYNRKGEPHNTQPDLGTELASTIPLGRLGHPSEVANVVVMLAKTGYMTGQDIVLGGGLL
jgi:NAD(P)-dependent dehydrogenase (short-subunit alcohol dehydrogenase family)